MRDRKQPEREQDQPERQAIEDKYVAQLDRRQAPDAEKRIEMYARDIGGQVSTADECRRDWHQWRARESQPEGPARLDAQNLAYATERNLAYARVLDGLVAKETGQSLRDRQAARDITGFDLAPERKVPEQKAREPEQKAPERPARPLPDPSPVPRSDPDQKPPMPAPKRIQAAPEQDPANPRTAPGRKHRKAPEPAAPQQARPEPQRPAPPERPKASIEQGRHDPTMDGPGPLPLPPRERAPKEPGTGVGIVGRKPKVRENDDKDRRRAEDEIDRVQRTDQRSRDHIVEKTLLAVERIQREQPQEMRHILADADGIRAHPKLQTSKALDEFLTQNLDQKSAQARGSEERGRYHVRCCAIAIVRDEVRTREQGDLKDYARETVATIRSQSPRDVSAMRQAIVDECLQSDTYLNTAKRTREIERALERDDAAAFAPSKELQRACVAHQMQPIIEHQFELEALRFSDPAAANREIAALEARLKENPRTPDELRDLYYNTAAMAVLDPSPARRAEYRDESREYALLIAVAEDRLKGAA
jgi:hypothetical protein